MLLLSSASDSISGLVCKIATTSYFGPSYPHPLARGRWVKGVGRKVVITGNSSMVKEQTP